MAFNTTNTAKRILVVEDHADIGKLIRMTLQGHCHRPCRNGCTMKSGSSLPLLQNSTAP